MLRVKSEGICRLDQPFAMKTCILVVLDLQVYICVPKARFIWPKGIHCFTFCDLLDGTRKSKIQTKKFLKNCIFASFQGDLACSWPGIEATNSFVTYPAKTLYFGLPGVQYQFCCINYEKFFTFKYYFENYIECLESN